jgi:hypothetical protein
VEFLVSGFAHNDWYLVEEGKPWPISCKYVCKELRRSAQYLKAMLKMHGTYSTESIYDLVCTCTVGIHFTTNVFLVEE